MVESYIKRLDSSLGLLPGRTTPSRIYDEVQRKSKTRGECTNRRQRLQRQFGYRHADYILANDLELAEEKERRNTWSQLAEQYSGKGKKKKIIRGVCKADEAVRVEAIKTCTNTGLWIKQHIQSTNDGHEVRMYELDRMMTGFSAATVTQERIAIRGRSRARPRSAMVRGGAAHEGGSLPNGPAQRRPRDQGKRQRKRRPGDWPVTKEDNAAMQALVLPFGAGKMEQDLPVGGWVSAGSRPQRVRPLSAPGCTALRRREQQLVRFKEKAERGAEVLARKQEMERARGEAAAASAGKRSQRLLHRRMAAEAAERKQKILLRLVQWALVMGMLERQKWQKKVECVIRRIKYGENNAAFKIQRMWRNRCLTRLHYERPRPSFTSNLKAMTAKLSKEEIAMYMEKKKHKAATCIVFYLQNITKALLYKRRIGRYRNLVITSQKAARDYLAIKEARLDLLRKLWDSAEHSLLDDAAFHNLLSQHSNSSNARFREMRKLAMMASTSSSRAAGAGGSRSNPFVTVVMARMSAIRIADSRAPPEKKGGNFGATAPGGMLLRNGTLQRIPSLESTAGTGLVGADVREQALRIILARRRLVHTQRSYSEYVASMQLPKMTMCNVKQLLACSTPDEVKAFSAQQMRTQDRKRFTTFLLGLRPVCLGLCFDYLELELRAEQRQARLSLASMFGDAEESHSSSSNIAANAMLSAAAARFRGKLKGTTVLG